MWDQIIQHFCRICSPQEIRFHLFNFWKFGKSEKSAPESYRMHWSLMNQEEPGPSKLLKLKYRSGGTNNSAVLQNRFSPRNWGPHIWFVEILKVFGSLKLLKLEYTKKDQIIQSSCRIGSTQEIRFPISNLKVLEKYSWIMQNGLKSNEWRKICVLETFKIEIQKRRPNNSAVLQDWFSPRH